MPDSVNFLWKFMPDFENEKAGLGWFLAKRGGNGSCRRRGFGTRKFSYDPQLSIHPPSFPALKPTHELLNWPIVKLPIVLLVFPVTDILPPVPVALPTSSVDEGAVVPMSL